MKVGWDTFVRRHAAASRGGGEWEDVAPVLDGAVAKLGKTDRQALILRYFEQKACATSAKRWIVRRRRQEARQPGCVQARGLMMKDKVTMPALALGVLLTANAVQAAPIDLGSKVTAAAMAARSGRLRPAPAHGDRQEHRHAHDVDEHSLDGRGDHPGARRGRAGRL
jgi:hypothetical protein